MSILDKIKKKKKKPHVFENVPQTARGHFMLHFYAAVYRLLFHLYTISGVEEGDPGELAGTFKKYPFLAGYFEETRRHMPEEITWEGALRWWKEQITAWEGEVTLHLPLRAVTWNSPSPFESAALLIIVGLVEEDSRFGTLFAHLQEPLGFRRAGLEFVGQLMQYDGNGGDTDAWGLLSLFLSDGLVEVLNKDAARSEWVLRVPTAPWDLIRGETPAHPVPGYEFHPAGEFSNIDALIFPGEFLQRLDQAPPLLKDHKNGAIVLRGSPGSDRFRAAGALARAVDRNIILVHQADRIDGTPELPGVLCTMTRAIPLFSCDTAPGETVDIPVLKGYDGPYIVLTGFEGGLRGKIVENAVTLTLPPLGAVQRKRCWQEALALCPGYSPANLEEISDRFHLPGDYIRQAAAIAAANAALDQRDVIRLDDVRRACRGLNRQLLDTLAARLETENEGPWDRLVVSRETESKLMEVEKRCRFRERLQENLGPAFGPVKNTGVRVLFSGVSGTGKTLAARILASELGMDLYRVDLASIVSKYIGETEKNLHNVLTRAEELDVILLLDEGDALLGTRTEVKTANDRYANLETDYLLQKLENYQGIVLITTNAEENIDSAFQRRMDVVVSFVPPRPDERLRIWNLHLPPDHRVEPSVLETVAARCNMTGGQIRNAALQAALLALDDGGKVGRPFLFKAVQSEYRKAGAICPLKDAGERQPRRGGVTAFIDALQS